MKHKIQRCKIPSVTTVALILSLGAVAPAEAQTIIWDTVSTGKVRLAVSNHGSMGLNGIGGANMDFAALGGDCDSTADVYLYSGGLFILQDLGGDEIAMNTGLYQESALSQVSFIPDPSGPPTSHFVGPDGSDAFFTGRFVNFDSTIGIERTYYAPTTGPPHDEFIVVRTDLYVLDGQAHGPLVIGEVIDWDIPASVATVNSDGHSDGYGDYFVYVSGTDTGGACQSNTDRTAYSSFLGQHTALQVEYDLCYKNRDYFGAFSLTVDSALMNADAGGITPSDALMYTEGYGGIYANEPDGNLQVTNTYVFNYNLGFNDTLTLYSAIVSGNNDPEATLGSADRVVCLWYSTNLRPGCNSLCGCCNEFLGDIDAAGNDRPDLGDLTTLIDYLFISFTPLVCPEEADFDYDCVIDLGDLTSLIFYLFIDPFYSKYPCPADFHCE